MVFFLRPRRAGWMIDGTVGMGGHAEALLDSTADNVRLLGLDRDPEALARAGVRLARFGARATLHRGSFGDLRAIAGSFHITGAQSILLDLGMSSYQLEESGRGFSFQATEPLDMRFDVEAGRTAADLVNHLSARDLAQILWEHGQEPQARRIAHRIVAARPLRTTADLVAAVRAAVPRARWPRRTHVATRTFQALRIAVNDETGTLARGLPEALALLATGGRCGVISFHSGEDRIVKHTFRSRRLASFAEVEPSPLTPGEDEARANPRARSAKLRVLERVGP